jgi:hypothetical protein
MGMGLLLALSLFAQATGAADAGSWLGIDLSNVTALQNRKDKPCRPEMEYRRGQLQPTGWAVCPEVRVQYRVLTVIVGEKAK